MEQLVEHGFANTYSVALVSARPYYYGKTNKGIYKYFRNENAFYGTISKPTGVNKGKEAITLSKKYDIVWQDLNMGRKFFIVEIAGYIMCSTSKPLNAAFETTTFLVALL